MLKVVFLVYLLGLPDTMETVVTTAIYKSVNTPVKGALRCAIQNEIQDPENKNPFFTVDAEGNCVLSQSSGSQYEKSPQVSGKTNVFNLSLLKVCSHLQRVHTIFRLDNVAIHIFFTFLFTSVHGDVSLY